MKLINLLLSIMVLIYVILYAVAPGLTLNGMGVYNSIKNLLLVVLAGVLVVKNYRHPTTLPKNFLWFVFLLSVLVIFEFCLSIASDVKSIVFGLIQLFIAARFGNARFFRCLYASILIATLISTIPLMYYFMILGRYARDLILFDKATLTFMFGFSYVLLVLEFIHKNIRRKAIILSILLYLIYVNVFILQSKTSVFVLLVAMALIAVLRRRETLGMLRMYWKQIVVVLLILPFLPIEWEIPDVMKQAANKLTGREMFVLEQNMKEDTYEIRARLRQTTYNIVLEKPLYGAGFGNMEKALVRSGTGVDQGESQLIDLLIEGGLTYLIAFFILTIPLILRSFKRIRRHRQTYADEFVFFQLVGFIINCAANETLSSLGWLFLGSLVYCSQRRESIIVFKQ